MLYDVVVIGGGPAGMTAAGRAGERGASVLLLEKNIRLGIKLLATGNGRCNITNTSADKKESLNVFGKNYKFLFSPYSQFGVRDTLEFFSRLGVQTKIEDKGRVFPQTDSSRDMQLALIDYLKKNKVEIKLRSEVKQLVGKKEKIEKIILSDGEEIFSNNFVIATGGKSFPSTGSTGDGYDWLKKIGHSINPLKPALTSVTVKNKFVKQLEGLSLEDVDLSVYQEKKKVFTRQGDVVFTSNGLSGPAIIDLSREIGLLFPSIVSLQLDFMSKYSLEEFEAILQKDFHHSNNKMIKNYLYDFLAPKLIPVILELSGVYEDKQVSSITKKERRLLVANIKEFNFEIKGLKGFERAMITAGGVDTREVDSKTMQSRLYKNLYLIGEILDLDGPSGGYNLQICWSTGYVAGNCIKF